MQPNKQATEEASGTAEEGGADIDSSRIMRQKLLVERHWRRFQQSRHSSIIQTIVGVVVLQPG